jgi:large subunit ribosomal protein L15e
MSHGVYYHIKQAWKKPDKEILRKRMIDWRHSPVISGVEKPLRLDRARALGYKAKKGFVIARIRIKRGGHKRPRPAKGRKGKRMHINKNLQMNYKLIAEQRMAKKYKNLEVLNSYQIGKDGVNYFFEIILVDPMRKEIQTDNSINWIASGKHRKRAHRGLTSSAVKSRGLR